MADPERYFIKPDYRSNLVQATYDGSENPAYWNTERLKSAASFQYDVYVLAAHLVSARAAQTLLDVGSGPPMKLKALFQNGGLKIHLVDQPSTAAQGARLLPHARFTAANLETVELDLGIRFDLIICADVIEHLINPDFCLAFIRQHLAPNGLLLISTPERDILRGRDCTSCPHPMHVREWNTGEFRCYLESQGLQVVEHLLLPQQRTSLAKKAWGKLLNTLGRPPHWYSCQLAVCRTR